VELWLLITILLGSLAVFLMLGIPVSFTMAGLSLVLGYYLWNGMAGIEGLVLASYSKVSEFVLVALPLYIFMAAILRYGDLTDGMYEAFYRWFGGLRGGLAVGTTLISTLYAAMVGITTVSVATLGVTARSSMLKKGYDDGLTSGIIVAGSGLGVLIPPSILMLIYASLAEVSPGKMFMAGILPGIVMAVILCLYCIGICYIKPNMGPAVPKDERYSWKEKFESLNGVILPIGIIAIVLVSIFAGIATPTESAAFGCVGSLVAAAINRKLTWRNFVKMLRMTVGITVSIFWIIIGAAAYSQIVTVTNIGQNLARWVVDMNLSAELILFVLFILFFLVGLFLDLSSLMFVILPIILPVLVQLDVDLIWFGIFFIMSCIIGNMSPPFGMPLFVLKSVAPDLNMGRLFNNVWVFIGVYVIGVILISVFPEIVLWLPNMMLKS
jgi:tripartite ATP-independent transporter DctM subunit